MPPRILSAYYFTNMEEKFSSTAILELFNQNSIWLEPKAEQKIKGTEREQNRENLFILTIQLIL